METFLLVCVWFYCCCFIVNNYFRYLTNEGIEYLRTYLHLPPEIVPATLKRQSRTETARPRPIVGRSEISKPSEDRAGYRRTPGSDKKADVGAGTGDLEFVSCISYSVTSK